MNAGFVLFLTLILAQGEVPPEKPSVFELPRLQARAAMMQLRFQELLKRKQYAEAETVVEEAIRLVPHDAGGHYNLACVLARQGKSAEAVAALEKAVSLGFNNVKHIETDDDLVSLRELEGYKKLLEKVPDAKPDPDVGWKYDVAPAPIESGVALVSEKNTALDQRTGLLTAFFKFEKPAAELEVVKGYGEAGDMVRKWHAEGTAAGLHGDLYDNHDRDHSNMDYEAFPQLARVEFVEDAKKRVLDHGLQLSLLYNAPTIGNSSTAHVHGVFWRSQARFALSQPRGAQLLFLQYMNNHLYFYPEHRDHDPGHNGANDGHGDVLPANTPYMLISQGSSGSDRPLMHTVALTIAALRPAVKEELVRQKVLMPAVQMIFRTCYKPVAKPEDYLTGKAHPSVFDGERLDLVRLVNMAHDITLDCLPPLAAIKIIEEDEPIVGVDYFDIAAREKMFDTPFAVARVIKSLKQQRRFVISAGESKDLNGKSLKYHFVVLRGDPAKITITPHGEGMAAEIMVQHHTRRAIAEGSAMESNRVDIGVFVQNEKYYSPPAFLSLSYLDNEKRTYGDQGRIVSVDYADPEGSRNYVDPLMDLKKNWRDDFQYDEAGRLLGWTRTRGETKQRFTHDGCLVTKTDDHDRPLQAKVVRYVSKQEPTQPGMLEQSETDELVEYEYQGDEKLGKRKAAAGSNLPK